MMEQSVQAPSSVDPRPSRARRTLTRVAAAGAVVIGILAVAAPSWAGPMTGC